MLHSMGGFEFLFFFQHIFVSASKYGGFDENKVMDIISTTGNCVAASIPLAFAMSLNEEKVKNNNLVYLIGTGAGLSIASILLKF